MFGKGPDFSLAEGIRDARRIEGVVEASEKAWADYKNSKEFKKLSLNIPEDALRYLIPRELLTVASDPSQVNLSVKFNSDEEQQNLGLSVYEGKGDLNDDNYIIETHFNSWANKPEVLYSNDYIDHKKFHGQGIGPGYYRQLEAFAKDLGYKYIVGINSPDNMSFFIDKLGRKHLLEAPKELQEYLALQENDFINALTTYKEL